MRPDEDFAQRAFHEHLVGLGLGSISWTPGTEPPDRYLTIGDQRFAVEITQIMEVVDLGSHAMPDHGVAQALARFGQDLEKEARKRGILHGSYAIYLEPIPHFKTRQAELTEKAFEYLSRTSGDESAVAALIGAYENGATIHIEKFSSSGEHLHYMTGGAGAKWGGQILHDLSTLIPSALADKTEKLKTLTIPKVVLLIDAYVYGKGAEWQAVVNGIARHPFHTIARVYDQHRCQILFSQDQRWYAAAA